MDLVKLKYFYMVAKYEHVTKAAEEIHIAQPALTKTVKILEKELGVSLFYKNGRNIALTEYGKFLKSELDKVFPILEGLDERLKSLKEESRKTVKLNVIASSTAVMEAVIEYKKQNPSVIFNLIQNQEKPDCDLSVRTNDGSFIDKGVKVAKCYRLNEKIYLAVPKNSKYANVRSIKLESVKGEDFVNLAGTRTFRTICDKFCAVAGFEPHIVFESDSLVAVRNIIGAEAGVCFWPEFTWGEINSADTVLLDIADVDCSRDIIIELHENYKLSEYAEDFYFFLIDFLLEKKELRS